MDWTEETLIGAPDTGAEHTGVCQQGGAGGRRSVNDTR